MMNSLIFHQIVNRLIVSPFIENVQADFVAKKVSFELKIPLFSAKPIVAPVFEKFVPLGLDYNKTENIKRYWNAYVSMALIPYNHLFDLNSELFEEESTSKLKFELKAK